MRVDESLLDWRRRDRRARQGCGLPWVGGKAIHMNIIRLRLEKTLRLAHPTSVHQQRRLGSRRRGSYTPGLDALPHRVTVCFSNQLKADLDALCTALNIERGIVVRDALAFYLAMAKDEFAANESLPTPVRPSRARPKASK
jgi:hypothetical protein